MAGKLRAGNVERRRKGMVPVKAVLDLPQGTSFDALSFAQDWQSSPLKAAPQSKSNNQEKTYFLGSRLIHSNAEE
jgi:hypothetical protein